MDRPLVYKDGRQGIRKGKIIKVNACGQVATHINGTIKYITLYYVIAELFISDYIEGTPITPIDGNRQNCRLDNLFIGAVGSTSGLLKLSISNKKVQHIPVIEGGFEEGERVLFDIKLANIMESMSNNTTNRIDQLQEVNKSLKEQNMKVLDLYLNNQISKDMFTTKQDELNKQLIQNEQELQLLQTPLLEKRDAIDEIKNKIKQVKTMSINNNYTTQEIYNMVEQIKVYAERYLTINIRINNILFEDDTKYYF